MLSVKKVNFRHMGRTKFPSREATASHLWSDYTDRVDIASLDLMQNMEIGGESHTILLGFKNLDNLMKTEPDG